MSQKAQWEFDFSTACQERASARSRCGRKKALPPSFPSILVSTGRGPSIRDKTLDARITRGGQLQHAENPSSVDRVRPKGIDRDAFLVPTPQSRRRLA